MVNVLLYMGVVSVLFSHSYSYMIYFQHIGFWYLNIIRYNMRHFYSGVWFLQVHGQHLMDMLIALEMDIIYLIRKVMIERAIVSVLVIVLVCAFQA